MSGTDPGDGSADADLDRLFGALAHSRRRAVLSCLWKHEVEMTLPDVAEDVAERENGTLITEIPAEEVRDVYMSLYHVHVPKLTEADLVEYDQEMDMLRLQRSAEEVIALLDQFPALPVGEADEGTD